MCGNYKQKSKQLHLKALTLLYTCLKLNYYKVTAMKTKWTIYEV